MKKPKDEDESDLSPYYEEALDTLLENPRVQGVIEKANGVLDSLGGLIDKVIKGEIKLPSKAPPTPAAAPKPRITAREVLHFNPKEVLTEEKIKARRKALAKILHPDKTKEDAAAMSRINQATDILLKGLKK